MPSQTVPKKTINAAQLVQHIGAMYSDFRPPTKRFGRIALFALIAFCRTDMEMLSNLNRSRDYINVIMIACQEISVAGSSKSRARKET